MDQQSLVVDDFGMFVGKKSERVVVKKDKKIVEEVPFFKLKEIMISSSGVSFSSDLIQECAKAGIQIDFITYRGKHLAKLSSAAMSGTIKTRREQLKAYQDQRGVDLAVSFAEGKIENQIVLLKYWAKYRKSKDIELYNLIYDNLDQLEKIKSELEDLTGDNIDQCRGNILSSEGRAAKIYWDTVKEILPESIKFPGRKTQGAQDLINSVLNYGYGILYSRVSSAILRAGLDLYAGFLHADRSGRPSLTMDLIEEFRQTIVDKTIVGLLNQNVKFEVKDGKIADDDRRKLANKILSRLESKERYEGKKYRLEVIIQKQARRLASHLQGNRKYKAFVSGW